MQEFELRFVNPVDKDIFFEVRHLIQSSCPCAFDYYQNYIICELKVDVNYDCFKDLISASLNYCNAHGRECSVNRVTFVCVGGSFSVCIKDDSHV